MVLKRIKQLFLTCVDEHRFSEALRRTVSEIAFIDGSRWRSPQPPICASISDATGSDVLLWNKAIVPTIIGLKKNEENFQGPLSGVVIMLQRCRTDNHLLLSGSIGWAANRSAPEAESMSRFAAEVWRVLGSVSSTRLAWVNPADGTVLDDKVTGFAIGFDAIDWCAASAIRRLKYRSTNNYYLPIGLAAGETNQR